MTENKIQISSKARITTNRGYSFVFQKHPVIAPINLTHPGAVKKKNTGK